MYKNILPNTYKYDNNSFYKHRVTTLHDNIKKTLHDNIKKTPLVIVAQVPHKLNRHSSYVLRMMLSVKYCG